MLSLLFALMVVTAFENTSSSSWDMVEVLLASELESNSSQHTAALDDFQELFNDFADTHGLHYNRRNFRVLETYNNDGFQVAKYGLRDTNCEEFWQFLSDIKAQKYHLQYAAVRCGPMTFSYCMAFSCPSFEFHSRGGGGLANGTSGGGSANGTGGGGSGNGTAG